jgi:large subunit ribosomal protein L21
MQVSSDEPSSTTIVSTLAVVILKIDLRHLRMVGAPTVDGAKVVCEVAEELVKGEHVIVFKKKRRKGYRRLNGHRQQFTKVVIKEVIA